MNSKLERILSRVQKPARYTGGELYSVIKSEDISVRFAWCFPDTYEVGMSHLGSKILYGLLNELDYVWCERTFAPWIDMEAELRAEGMPLYTLESYTPLGVFDMLGFSLQYELSYTNVLNMLALAGIPLRAVDRESDMPLVIGGGPCVCNPEPVAVFFDLFVLGEAEEVLPELTELYRRHKEQGYDKATFLQEACHIEGIYVPALYEVTYNESGLIEAVTPLYGAPERVKKRIIRDVDKVFFPREFVVPFIETVHDRTMVEVLRGCIRGCRFCQAGFIYRPFREKSPDVLDHDAHELCDACGYDEVSLTSLSTGDYRRLDELLTKMLRWSEEAKVNLSLPSTRIDSFSKEIADKLATVRKSSMTFAPEAGSQRLRDVINKNLTEEDILSGSLSAYAGGYTNIKLYFMFGLPTETMEDIEEIAHLASRVAELYYTVPTRNRNRGVSVSCSAACFVPKPFTPFQWEAQDTIDMLQEKGKYLTSVRRSKRVNVKWHEPHTSVLEGVMARADRRVADVIELAFNKGCHMDGWGELFQYDVWMQCFDEVGLEPAFYAHRKRSFDELLPWDHLDYGIDKSYLQRECERAYEGQSTPSCREQCGSCGASKWVGGRCDV